MTSNSRNLLVAALSLAVLAPALARAEPPGLDLWSRNHARASRELGAWVQHHPQAARMIFEWDGTHPQRSREFVTWAVANPGAPVRAFLATHPGWPTFDRIAATHRPATNRFMGWCRRHPGAAEALVAHPGGLRWAGDHLYAERWQLKHPRR